MPRPRSPITNPAGPGRHERRVAFRESTTGAVASREVAVTGREEVVLARERAAQLREEAVRQREEAARLREKTARLREETDRAEAASVQTEVNRFVLQLRDANQQLVIASLRAQTATEAADQANRLKDEFLATVSHELRTPLTAVVGWASMLHLNQVKPDRVGHAITTIERNAAILTQLIEDLLDESRITAGALHLDTQAVNLGAVIGAAIDTVRPTAAAKGVQLHASEASSTDPIPGDARRLQQVVWNLLSNAIKFTSRGGRVDIDVRRVNSTMELRVSDTGQGISAAFLPLVFERFRMADASPRRRESGLGLGLAIVRQIVELHGGRVRAESPGTDQGTTVTVTLPILPVVTGTTPVPDVLRTEDAILDALSLAQVSVLLVEDNDDERELTRLVLEAAGATVASVSSAREAIEVLDVVQPHVLVSDIGLPGEDGYALIRQLRSHDALRGRFLPGIALTGYASPEDRTAATAAGFQTFLAKPAKPTELWNAIAAVVSATRPRL